MKKKNIIFICQLTENSLKVIKCLTGKGAKRKIVDLAVEEIPPDIDDKTLSEKINSLLKRLGFHHHRLLLSLARSKATCRYLKVPTQIPQEIDNIVSLQAPRYLPYPTNELITGYKSISTDQEGYSHINVVIVHKATIEHLVGIFKEVGVVDLTVVLSSYGLANFYDFIQPQDPEVTMLIDIDLLQVELAIVSKRALIFSRYFRLDRSGPNWENAFIAEINKSRDAYLKETSQGAPHKIVLVGAGKNLAEFARILNTQADLPVELISYDKINLSPETLKTILDSESSFASMLGLGLKGAEASLNLLPRELKEEARKITQRKEWVNVSLLIGGVILLAGLGLAKTLDNKNLYLRQLKIELDKIAKDAKPLEEIEKRLEFLARHAQKELSSLDVLSEIYRVIPQGVTLVNFNYEEDRQIILRGQAAELNNIFSFNAELEKSALLEKFNIKVRYATKRKTLSGEIVDFEIVCLK